MTSKYFFQATPTGSLITPLIIQLFWTHLTEVEIAAMTEFTNDTIEHLHFGDLYGPV